MLTKDGVPQDNAGHPDLVNQNDGSTFDAIGYSRKLTEAGLPAEVAETMARLAQQDKAELAQNLAALRTQLKAWLDRRDNEFRDKQEQILAAFRTGLKDELARRDNARMERFATRAEVEKIRGDLNLEIANERTEREKLRGELSVDIIRNRVDSTIDAQRSSPFNWALILLSLFFSVMSFLIARPHG